MLFECMQKFWKIPVSMWTFFWQFFSCQPQAIFSGVKPDRDGPVESRERAKTTTKPQTCNSGLRWWTKMPPQMAPHMAQYSNMNEIDQNWPKKWHETEQNQTKLVSNKTMRNYTKNGGWTGSMHANNSNLCFGHFLPHFFCIIPHNPAWLPHNPAWLFRYGVWCERKTNMKLLGWCVSMWSDCALQAVMSFTDHEVILYSIHTHQILCLRHILHVCLGTSQQ